MIAHNPLHFEMFTIMKIIRLNISTVLFYFSVGFSYYDFGVIALQTT